MRSRLFRPGFGRRLTSTALPPPLGRFLAERYVGFGRRLTSTALPPPLGRFLAERYVGWSDGSDSLSSSECEALTLSELMVHADDVGRERWLKLSLGYPDQPGSEDLRRTIAASEYTTVHPDQLNVLAPAEGIYLAMRALLKPGDHVVATTPHYQSLSEVARAVGCDLSFWEPEGLGSGGTPRFAPEALEDLLRPGRTRLLVANWPHNPTGAVPTPAELERVVAACDAVGCHLFLDEMYRGLEHGDTARLPAAVDAYERGVSLGGLSKAYALPGLRIGWLASRDAALMARVAELKDYTTICPPAPSEALALIALRAREPLLSRSRELVAAGLHAARAHVLAFPGLLEWSEPSGGTFAFVRLRGGVAASRYCDALRERCAMPAAAAARPTDRRRRDTV